MERINTHQKHLETLSFNQKMLLTFGKVLGSPWTVYIFIAIALVGLTQTNSLSGLITWFSQTFVQFVALAVLQGASNLQSRHSEIRAEEEYKKVLHEDKELDEIKKLLTEINLWIKKKKKT